MSTSTGAKNVSVSCRQRNLPERAAGSWWHLFLFPTTPHSRAEPGSNLCEESFASASAALLCIPNYVHHSTIFVNSASVRNGNNLLWNLPPLVPTGSPTQDPTKARRRIMVAWSCTQRLSTPERLQNALTLERIDIFSRIRPENALNFSRMRPVLYLKSEKASQMTRILLV